MIVPLTREEFETAYRAYMANGGYSFEAWDLNAEWDRYSRGRSWFLYTFHGEHALAVCQALQKGG